MHHDPTLAFLRYGEGYHNFHHVFQNDYRDARLKSRVAEEYVSFRKQRLQR